MIITVNATVCVMETRVSNQRFMIIYSDPGRGCGEARKGQLTRKEN
jgi:hypothetical protein